MTRRDRSAGVAPSRDQGIHGTGSEGAQSRRLAEKPANTRFYPCIFEKHGKLPFKVNKKCAHASWSGRARLRARSKAKNIRSFSIKRCGESKEGEKFKDDPKLRNGTL